MTFPTNPWRQPIADPQPAKGLEPVAARSKPKRGPAPNAAGSLPFDITQLKVERGIAPSAASVTGESKWAPLIALMKEPGESVEFPGEHKSAVAAAVLQLAKRTGKKQFVVRKTSGTSARIFRIA